MGLRAGDIAKCIGCSFFVLGVKTVLFFLCAIEHYSIIKLVFLHKIKRLNRMIGKPDESLGRKATGPVKWQPVVLNGVHCLWDSVFYVNRKLLHNVPVT